MKKKIMLDSFLNVISSALPVLVLQIFILPIVAMNLGEEGYGLAITLISLATLFSVSFGNVLNNVRLLTARTYEKENVEGDFNVLLSIFVTFNSLIIIMGGKYYEESIIGITLLIMLSGMNLLREYLIVAFRIKLDYKKILKNNIMLAFGYLLGLIFFTVIPYWQIIYITGSSLSLLYIIRNSGLLKEPFQRTIFLKDVTYKSLVLFISTFMKTALTYADKLVLYPLIGPSAVSIYYSATLMGKIISMGITPISGVMLSHLANVEKMRLKTFFSIISTVSIFGVLGYLIILLISEPVLTFIYPQWAQSSVNLIPITTATAIVNVISSIIHPIILRYNHINWQFFINGVNLIAYILFVIIFYNLYGLIGFASGILVANIVKLLLMIMVYLYNFHNISDISHKNN